MKWSSKNSNLPIEIFMDGIQSIVSKENEFEQETNIQILAILTHCVFGARNLLQHLINEQIFISCNISTHTSVEKI